MNIEDNVEGKGEEGKQNLLLQTPFPSRELYILS